MNVEITTLERNHIWSLVLLPLGHKAIGCRWVYKIKDNSDDFAECYKARMVAKRYTQVKGIAIDYKEIFSLTVKLTKLRSLLTVVIENDSLISWMFKMSFSMVI